MDRRSTNVHRLISTADVNATLVKGSPADLHGLIASNINAAVRYLKLYDKATAPSETDTPKLTIALTAGTTGPVSGFIDSKPVEFRNGLGFRITTGVADNDIGAVAAGEIVINLIYL